LFSHIKKLGSITVEYGLIPFIVGSFSKDRATPAAGIRYDFS